MSKVTLCQGETFSRPTRPTTRPDRHSMSSVSVSFPAGTVVPAFYTLELDARRITDALSVGSNAVLAAVRKAEEAVNEDKRETTIQADALLDVRLKAALQEERAQWEADKQRALTAAANETSLVREEVRHARDLLATSQRLHAEELDRINLAYTATKAQLDGQAATLDIVRRTERESALADARELYAQQLNLAHSTLADFKAHITEERALRQLELSSVEQLRCHASKKGAVGELTLRNLLFRAFSATPDYHLEDTSKKARSGDTRLRIHGVNTIWDAKAHNATRSASNASLRAVEKKEVVKMKRDMRTNPDVRIGFLVGLRADIACHAGRPYDVELLGSSQILVYINKLLDHDSPAHFLQDYIGPLVRVVSVWAHTAPDNAEPHDDVRAANCILECLRGVSGDMLRHLGDCNRRHRDTKRRAAEALDASKAELAKWQRYVDDLARTLAGEGHAHEPDPAAAPPATSDNTLIWRAWVKHAAEAHPALVSQTPGGAPCLAKNLRDTDPSSYISFSDEWHKAQPLVSGVKRSREPDPDPEDATTRPEKRARTS